MDAEVGTKTVFREPAAVQPPTLTLEQLEADPHGVFRRYRKDHPVVLHETGGHFVLRFADVDRLSRDPRFLGAETAFPKMLGLDSGAIFDIFDHGMLTANGDVHRRRRAPFSRLFAARAISEMRPRIRRTIEDLIDGCYGNGELEFVEFAGQIPARVIADLLGLPREDIPDFTRMAYKVTRILGFGLNPDEIAEIEAHAEELRDYVGKALDERRRGPRDDFLSAFLAAATEAGEMSPEEILFQIFQLIAAATDTTRVAMAIQTALLLQHREQWTAVCRDPALIPAAVAEALRFEPTVTAVVRVPNEDVEIEGVVLPAGQLVTLSIMSAMRDEQAYDGPDMFDIHRTKQPRLHPVFGYGAHRCIGEALARAELEESLAAISARMPDLQLDAAPTLSGHFGIRAVDTMRVSWMP
jgi:cytochrome P450 family 103